MAQRRSANTCAECRARKVKCDSRRSTCTPCERLRLRCSFERGEVDAHATPDPEALLGTRRVQAACTSCRASRVRCSGERPQCQRCANKGSACVYVASKRRFGHTRNDSRASRQSPVAIQTSETRTSPIESGTSSTHASHVPITPTPSALSNVTPIPSSTIPAEITAISLSLDGPTIMGILDAFFQHIHPLPVYSFFHKASLIHRFEAGLLKPGLLLALIGTTCEMLEMGSLTKEIARHCLSKAETMVVEDIGTPSAVKIQALVLIVKAHCRQGRMTAAFVLFAVAARFAYALRLNHETPDLCFLERESRRRLMWSLFMVDMILAGGIRELALCPAESMYIQLPCQERNFELDLEQKTEPLQPVTNQPTSDNFGSLAAYVRICWLRYRILQTTKEAVLSKGEAVDQLPTKIEQLASDLAAYEAHLPPDLRFSKRNLQLRAYSPRLSPYILIHIFCRQCYCDLYRVVMTGLKEALREDQLQRLDPNIVSEYSWKCFESSKELSKVLSCIQAVKNRVLTMDADIQICAYQCVRLLLQCYRQRDRTVHQVAPNTFHELISQCAAAIEAMPSASSLGQRIEQDFKKLLRQGQSAEPSPTRHNSLREEQGLHHTPVVSAASHLFSRHSITGQMDITDDSAELSMRDNLEHQNQQSSSSAELHASFSAVSADPGSALGGRYADSQRMSDWSALASFNEFQGDLGELFNNDTINLDLFDWAGDHRANPL